MKVDLTDRLRALKPLLKTYRDKRDQTRRWKASVWDIFSSLVDENYKTPKGGIRDLAKRAVFAKEKLAGIFSDRGMKVKVRPLEEEIQATYDKITADYHPRVYGMAEPVIKSLLSRSIDSIFIEGEKVKNKGDKEIRPSAFLSGLKELESKGTMAFEMEHKSHYDYVIFPTAAYLSGLHPPLIAAGDNIPKEIIPKGIRKKYDLLKDWIDKAGLKHLIGSLPPIPGLLANANSFRIYRIKTMEKRIKDMANTGDEADLMRDVGNFKMYMSLLYFKAATLAGTNTLFFPGNRGSGDACSRDGSVATKVYSTHFYDLVDNQIRKMRTDRDAQTNMVFGMPSYEIIPDLSHLKRDEGEWHSEKFPDIENDTAYAGSNDAYFDLSEPVEIGGLVREHYRNRALREGKISQGEGIQDDLLGQYLFEPSTTREGNRSRLSIVSALKQAYETSLYRSTRATTTNILAFALREASSDSPSLQDVYAAGKEVTEELSGLRPLPKTLGGSYKIRMPPDKVSDDIISNSLGLFSQEGIIKIKDDTVYINKPQQLEFYANQLSHISL